MIPYTGFKHLAILGFRIPLWGAFQVIAVSLFLFLSYREAKRLKIGIYEWKVMVLLGSITALLGMRLYHLFIVKQGKGIFNTLIKFVTSAHGVDSAGSILGVAAAIAYLKLKRLNIGRFLDTLAFPGTVLIMFARMGCMCALCETGIKTMVPWAIYYNNASRHPVALYYILNGLFMFFVFLLLRKKRWHDGFLINVFFIIYPLMRFLIDFLRVFPQHDHFGMSVHQIAYLIIFICASLILAINLKKAGKPFLIEKL